MKFKEEFTALDKIELLHRSMLVNSMAYYELNNNILTDFQYDDNAKQLEVLTMEYYEAAKKSRYWEYFDDFFGEGDDTHMTSGFDLLMRVRKKDPDLYRRIRIDAYLALQLKEEKYEKV